MPTVIPSCRPKAIDKYLAARPIAIRMTEFTMNTWLRCSPRRTVSRPPAYPSVSVPDGRVRTIVGYDPGKFLSIKQYLLEARQALPPPRYPVADEATEYAAHTGVFSVPPVSPPMML